MFSIADVLVWVWSHGRAVDLAFLLCIPSVLVLVLVLRTLREICQLIWK